VGQRRVDVWTAAVQIGQGLNQSISDSWNARFHWAQTPGRRLQICHVAYGRDLASRNPYRP